MNDKQFNKYLFGCKYLFGWMGGWTDGWINRWRTVWIVG